MNDRYAFRPIADAVGEHLPVPDIESDSPFARERVALSNERVELTLTAGDAFPDAELVTVRGKVTSMSAELGGRPAVVVFYRGAWCPFCNIALRAYRDHLVPTLREQGVGFMAVSPQMPDSTLSMQEKDGLEFTVVSDEGNTLASRLGILTRPTADAIRTQLDNGLDLTQLNADGTVSLPMPTTVIIDEDGVIAWIDVHPDYSLTTEPTEVLARLDALGIGAPTS